MDGSPISSMKKMVSTLSSDLREEYYEFLTAEMDVNVHNLSKEENLSLILSNTEFSAIRASAKFCSQILECRRSF